jgi:hypothetical protein
MKVIKPEYLKDLRQLTEFQRSALVISIASAGHVLSRYGDHIWDFTPYIHINGTPKGKKKIDFSSLLFKDGSCLTDPQHSLLLAGGKAFLYVRLTVNSPISGKPLGASTIIQLWQRALHSLLHWMADAGLHCFADLSPESCLAYAAYTRTKVGRKRERLSAATLYDLFSCLEDLWTFRVHLPDALSQQPWSGRSSASLAGYSCIGGKDINTEQIADRLMVKLVQGALRYMMDGYGDRLLTCRDARDCGRPIDDHLAQLGLNNWLAAKKEITKLLTACYVIIDAFSGMRVSEVLSLETGCYYEHEGWDGATYGWLRGITYKLEENPKPGEWMVPPVVEQAVRMATRVTAPVRAKLEKRIAALEAKLRDIRYLDDSLRQKDAETLNEMKKHRMGLFLAEHSTINTSSDASISTRLKAFARHLDLKVETSDLEQVRDKSRIRVGEILRMPPKSATTDAVPMAPAPSR